MSESHSEESIAESPSKSFISAEALTLATVPIIAYGLALVYEMRFAAVWGIPTGWIRVSPGALIVPIYSVALIVTFLWIWIIGSLSIVARSKSKLWRMLWITIYPAAPLLLMGLVLLSIGWYWFASYVAMMLVFWIIFVWWKGDPELWAADADQSLEESKLVELLLLPIDSMNKLGVERPRVCAVVLVIAICSMFLAGEYAAKNAPYRYVIGVDQQDYLILRSTTVPTSDRQFPVSAC